MEGLKFFLFLLTLTSLIVENLGNKRRQCPTFKNLANFTCQEDIYDMQEDVMERLWNDEELKNVSNLTTKFLDILYDMFDEDDDVEYDDPCWRRYVLTTSEYVWAYLPDIKSNINLCSYAQMINSTVDFFKNKNCETILNAINKSTEAFTEAGIRLSLNGIKRAGCVCNDFRELKVSEDKCYKNGFVYDIKKMWSESGKGYPRNLRDVVFELYKSSDLSDKIIALFATAVLSKHMAIMENKYEPEPLYKLFLMFSEGEIPKHCCEKYIKEAKELSDLIQIKNKDIFKLAMESVNCLNRRSGKKGLDQCKKDKYNY